MENSVIGTQYCTGVSFSRIMWGLHSLVTLTRHRQSSILVHLYTEGGQRFMAVWRKEEVDAARHY